MTRSDLQILQVSASDVGGGAENVALTLHRAYVARGLGAHLALGTMRRDTPAAVEIPGGAPRTAISFAGRMRRRASRLLADPGSIVDRVRGLEDFNFAGTRQLLSLTSPPPNVLHLHNLHGGYFDLRELPTLSHALPTVITLHDTWLTAGHCAYTLGCPRWLTGCGECPDISRPMAIPRDSSAANWRRKRDIYARSRLFIAGPSRWVLQAAAESILAEATAEQFLIPNGVDTAVFAPGDKAEARRMLGLDPEAFLVMFTAGGERPNPFKGTATVLAAVPGVSAQIVGRRVVFLALGGVETSLPGDHVVRVPFVEDPATVARYLQASDIYIHMAVGDNQPLAILEALACGTPVVASAVGGIPEIIADGVTGVLVPMHDTDALTAAIVSLANDSDRLHAMGSAAAAYAKANLTVDRMVDAYLAMYQAMLSARGMPAPA
jgi:glycosyltransferase involved in cell wall biosynthesis